MIDFFTFNRGLSPASPKLRTLVAWYLRRLVLLPELVLGIRFFRIRMILDEGRSNRTEEETYRYFDYQFRHRAPLKYWLHNKYFKENNRGFGEHPFHSLWIQLFQQIRPGNCLEIGVYRGQTISLWTMLQEDNHIEGRIVGLTPLSNQGDSVSDYLELDYQADIIKNFEFFGISKPKLVAHSSTSTEAVRFIRSICWDLVYIDGSHDLEVVTEDFQNAYRSLSPKGILVMDDSSKFMDSLEHLGAFSGHHGPSVVAETLAKERMTHVMRVGHLNVFQKHTADGI